MFRIAFLYLYILPIFWYLIFHDFVFFISTKRLHLLHYILFTHLKIYNLLSFFSKYGIFIGHTATILPCNKVYGTPTNLILVVELRENLALIPFMKIKLKIYSKLYEYWLTSHGLLHLPDDLIQPSSSSFKNTTNIYDTYVIDVCKFLSLDSIEHKTVWDYVSYRSC